jgi:hypothetical protein
MTFRLIILPVFMPFPVAIAVILGLLKTNRFLAFGGVVV